MFDIIFKLFQWMPWMRALGKVDELLEKVHWWMTGEIDRDEERRGEKTPNQQKEEREKLHSGIICALLLSFYFGTEETVEWRKWRFPVLLLFLSPTTTKVNCGFFPPSLSWVGWGFSNHSMIMSVPPFLAHNPLMCSFAFSSFALFFCGRG